MDAEIAVASASPALAEELRGYRLGLESGELSIEEMSGEELTGLGGEFPPKDRCLRWLRRRCSARKLFCEGNGGGDDIEDSP